MADGISINTGTAATVATELIAGFHLQRIKMALGTTDTDGGNISSTNPMPVLSGTAGNFLVTATPSSAYVVISGTAGNFLATVSGTVTVGGTVTSVSGTASALLAQVSQGTAGNLLATVNCGTAGNLLTTSIVSCGTAANLLTTSIVSCGTAGNLLTTSIVSCGTAGNLLTTSIVSCGTAGNLLSTVSCGTAANLLTTSIVSCGTAANLLTTSLVSCGTAANLLTLSTITAGTNSIGQVIAGQQYSFFNGTASLTPSYASVSFTGSAGNTVISGVASKNIYVLNGLIIAQAATNIQFWQNSTASTALTGVMCLAANAGFQIPYSPIGNFATTSTNQGIQISSSVATTVGGWLAYVAF